MSRRFRHKLAPQARGGANRCARSRTRGHRRGDAAAAIPRAQPQFQRLTRDEDAVADPRPARLAPRPRLRLFTAAHGADRAPLGGNRTLFPSRRRRAARSRGRDRRTRTARTRRGARTSPPARSSCSTASGARATHGWARTRDAADASRRRRLVGRRRVVPGAGHDDTAARGARGQQPGGGAAAARAGGALDGRRRLLLRAEQSDEEASPAVDASVPLDERTRGAAAAGGQRAALPRRRAALPRQGPRGSRRRAPRARHRQRRRRREAVGDRPVLQPAHRRRSRRRRDRRGAPALATLAAQENQIGDAGGARSRAPSWPPARATSQR